MNRDELARLHHHACLDSSVAYHRDLNERHGHQFERGVGAERPRRPHADVVVGVVGEELDAVDLSVHLQLQVFGELGGRTMSGLICIGLVASVSAMTWIGSPPPFASEPGFRSLKKPADSSPTSGCFTP